MYKEVAKQYKINQASYGKLFDHLMAVPSTAHDLVDVCGLHITTIHSLLRVLRQHKVVYITGWEKDPQGRDRTAVFAFGRGRDKPRHKQTGAERGAKYRARVNMKLLAAATAGVAA